MASIKDVARVVSEEVVKSNNKDHGKLLRIQAKRKRDARYEAVTK